MMNKIPKGKYKPYPKIKMPNRKWPDNVIEKAPIWCSVDLRDGNQALINPMSMEKKLELFTLNAKLKTMQLTNTSELRVAKKDIARIQTAITAARSK